MKYFARITQDHWTHKNNLEAAVHQLFKRNDATLIHGNIEKNAFIGFIRLNILLLNKEHFRCKPKELITSGPSENPKSIYVPGVVHMEIIEVANERNPK